jgi:hypothetical protein
MERAAIPFLGPEVQIDVDTGEHHHWGPAGYKQLAAHAEEESLVRFYIVRDEVPVPHRHAREAQSGSCMERENLAGDAKGKGASGSNREAESTDAPERGGLPRSSVEAG